MLVTEETFPSFIQRIEETARLTLDTETSGLDVWHKDRLCGIGVCFSEDQSWGYFPFRHRAKELPLFKLAAQKLNLSEEFLQQLLTALRKVPVMVGHNIKFDLAALSREGYRIGPGQRIEDTIVGARIYFPTKHADLSLAGCIKEVLGKAAAAYKGDFWDYLKRHGIEGHAELAPPEVAAEYCGSDTTFTSTLRDFFLQHIEKTGQQRVWDQECELLEVLHNLERVGFAFDRDYCERQLPKLAAAARELQRTIYSLSGQEFDIASNPELAAALAAMKIKPVSYNKPTVAQQLAPYGAKEQGSAKWDKAALKQLAHPIGKLIAQYRQVVHLDNTYFRPLAEIAALGDGCVIHPNMKSWGTVTGRMSCTQPNLQNLTNKPFDFEGESVDDAEAASVKRLYIPRPGFALYFYDYQQAEMRIFADYMGDKAISAKLEVGELAACETCKGVGTAGCPECKGRGSYMKPLDYHLMVAREVWGAAKAKEYRRPAKDINFALIYGVGDKRLALQMNKSLDEAKEYKKKYFERMPLADTCIQKNGKEAERKGYVTNRFGRQYVIPTYGHNANMASVATNYLVQGTSADIVKNRMIAVSKYLKDNGYLSRTLLQVHDEVALEIADDELELVPIIKDILEERLIATYLPVDVAVGRPSWGQKEKVVL